MNNNPRCTVYNNKGLKVERGYNSFTNEVVWFFDDGKSKVFLNLGELECLMGELNISRKFYVEITNRSEEK